MRSSGSGNSAFVRVDQRRCQTARAQAPVPDTRRQEGGSRTRHLSWHDTLERASAFERAGRDGTHEACCVTCERLVNARVSHSFLRATTWLALDRLSSSPKRLG